MKPIPNQSFIAAALLVAGSVLFSFVAEKSSDGIHFLAFSEIAATGNSTTIREYKTNDEKPFREISYYRIRSIDIDGSFSYTKVLYIKK